MGPQLCGQTVLKTLASLFFMFPSNGRQMHIFLAPSERKASWEGANFSDGPSRYPGATAAVRNCRLLRMHKKSGDEERMRKQSAQGLPGCGGHAFLRRRIYLEARRDARQVLGDTALEGVLYTVLSLLFLAVWPRSALRFPEAALGAVIRFPRMKKWESGEGSYLIARVRIWSAMLVLRYRCSLHST